MAVNEISISVHLHNVLRRRTPGGWQSQVEQILPAESRVQDLLGLLDFELPDEAIIIILDRRSIPPDHVLQDGDIVHLLPALSGG